MTQPRSAQKLFASVWHSRMAASALHQGGVIAYPTEGVWGLGCDPFNEAAVNRLLALKQRPVHKGLILIAANLDQVDFLLRELTAEQRAQLAASWPGFSTWLVPDRLDQIPAWVKGQHSSVALRVSAHPVVQSLCLAFGGPLVSTSANLAGRPSALQSWQVRGAFQDGIDYLMPGSLGGEHKSSPVTDLASGKKLRV